MNEINVADVLKRSFSEYTKIVINCFEYQGEKYLVTRDSDDNILEAQTESGFIVDGWTKPVPLKEMTVKEVEEALGHPVKIIK